MLTFFRDIVGLLRERFDLGAILEGIYLERLWKKKFTQFSLRKAYSRTVGPFLQSQRNLDGRMQIVITIGWLIENGLNFFMRHVSLFAFAIRQTHEKDLTVGIFSQRHDKHKRSGPRIKDELNGTTRIHFLKLFGLDHLLLGIRKRTVGHSQEALSRIVVKVNKICRTPCDAHGKGFHLDNALIVFLEVLDINRFSHMIIHVQQKSQSMLGRVLPRHPILLNFLVLLQPTANGFPWIAHVKQGDKHADIQF